MKNVAPEAGGVDVPAPAFRSETPRILVVDDSREMRACIAGILVKQGWETAQAADGLEAVNQIKSGHFHMATLDMEMPIMSGIQTLRIMHAIDRDLSVLVVSGQSDLRMVAAAIHEGAYDYIVKPFNDEELVQNVRRGLESRFLALENRWLIEELRRVNAHLEDLVSERTARLEEALHSLRELDELKVKFIGLASHELITPLTLLQSFTDLQASVLWEDPDKRRRITEAISLSIDRLVSTVREITDIAHLKEGRAVYRQESIILGDLAAEAMHELWALTAPRGVSLTADFPGISPVVRGDSVRLRQVIDNLLVHALRRTTDNQRIVIAIRREGTSQVTLTVTDAGQTVPTSHLEHIFDEFYEESPLNYHHSGTVQFGAGGIGLGLAVAREIVKAHQGRIYAESPAPGAERGCAMTLVLPLA